AGLLFGTAQGIVYPTLNAFTVEGVPVEELGRAQTFYNGAFNLGTTTGSLALGHVAERAGHRMMFLIAAAVVATAFVVFSVGTGAYGPSPPATPATGTRLPGCRTWQIVNYSVSTRAATTRSTSLSIRAIRCSSSSRSAR